MADGMRHMLPNPFGKIGEKKKGGGGKNCNYSHQSKKKLWLSKTSEHSNTHTHTHINTHTQTHTWCYSRWPVSALACQLQTGNVFQIRSNSRLPPYDTALPWQHSQSGLVYKNRWGWWWRWGCGSVQDFAEMIVGSRQSKKKKKKKKKRAWLDHAH